MIEWRDFPMVAPPKLSDHGLLTAGQGVRDGPARLAAWLGTQPPGSYLVLVQHDHGCPCLASGAVAEGVDGLLAGLPACTCAYIDVHAWPVDPAQYPGGGLFEVLS